MNLTILLITLTAFLDCVSKPTDIPIEQLHPTIKEHYYSESPKIVLTNPSSETSEKIELPSCTSPQACGNVVLIVCGVDGVIDYINNTNGKVIESSGGRCNFGFSSKDKDCKKHCPPKKMEL